MKRVLSTLLLAAAALCSSCDKETITAAPSDDMTYSGYISSTNSISGHYNTVEKSACNSVINHKDNGQTMTLNILPFYYKASMGQMDKVGLRISDIPSTGQIGEYKQDNPQNTATGYEIESVWVQQDGGYIELVIRTNDGYTVSYDGWGVN